MKKEEKKTPLAEAENSQEKTQDILWHAIHNRFGDRVYMLETYPDYVIVEVEGKYLKVEYTIDNQDSVTLAPDTTPVERKYIVMTEALAGCKLIEAVKDSDGSEWDVVLIEAGQSGNRRFWPSQVLAEAAPLFDGARALARADEKHLKDTDKSVKNIVGWFSSPHFTNNQVMARFHISEAAGWLKTLMADAWNRGKKDIVGFSVVADGMARLKKQDGRLVQFVESIERVCSVDVVVEASAGGKILKMAAAKDNNPNMEDLEKMEKLLKLIESKRPDIYKKIDPENIEMDEILALLTEALAEPEPGNGNDPKIQPSSPAQEDGTGAQAAKELLAEAQDILVQAKEEGKKTIRLAECRETLTTKLTESKLPKMTQDRIRDRFSGQVFEGADLDTAIKSEREYLAKLTEAGNVRGVGSAEIGEGEREKTLKALDGFFAGENIDNIPKFRYFREAYEVITGDRDVTGLFRKCINLHKFTEALSASSFGDVLGDSIARRMQAEYAEPELKDIFKIISEISNIKDFRDNPRMKIGGYGDMPLVAEEGTYQPLTSPADTKESYSISKYGGLETITFEMVANDDQRAVKRIPRAMGRGSARTLRSFVLSLLTDNAVMNEDSKAVFHADHSNLRTSAMSDTELSVIRQAMRSQTPYGQVTKPLGLVPKTILAPNELEKLAWKLVNAALQVASGESTPRYTDVEPNFHAKQGMDVIIVDEWSDADNFYTACNTKDCPTIELGFYNGQQEPELFVQDSPTGGSVFSADKITYKIRHIYGGVILDYRGLSFNQV